MKLRDMFTQYFKEHEKEGLRDAGQGPRPHAAGQQPDFGKAIVPYTGMFPGSDIRPVPGGLENVSEATKGLHR